MFVFQVGAQKPFEQQQFTTKIFTGAEAQRLIKVIGPAVDLTLSKVHGKPESF